jgi:hypothetical protein
MGKRGKIAKNKLPVAETAGIPYKPTKADMERERRYRAEHGLRILTEADEIRNNKEIMSDVKQLAKEQMATAKKFAK